MTEIVLAKRTDTAPTKEQAEVLRAYLFDVIDGLSESDQASWRRFWNWIIKSGSGEIFSIQTWTPRNGKFHRLHMLTESRVFKGQERIKSFDQFRSWLKIGAGFVDWMAGPKGGVVPVPRSLSYSKADEDVMRQFHVDALAFLRTSHAQRYLWPHLPADKAEEMIETILARLER
jgi:hypothetical protein